ncbi:hypothetical protein A5844_000772 [Enterococcus sp. 10A9_DIV0425]|uniref:Uncharacterized protein n=1 Tax=Candidatus Enterococcus wittei TaxID=1987383 RepID=A0A2C9XQW2_9ENTE|nr:hypothetical protein A5844_000772 [Enterococcus sp. 10A9_DIV0425]
MSTKGNKIKIVFNLLLLIAIPVSYTHLDVYIKGNLPTATFIDSDRNGP